MTPGTKLEVVVKKKPDWPNQAQRKETAKYLRDESKGVTLAVLLKVVIPGDPKIGLLEISLGGILSILLYLLALRVLKEVKKNDN